MLVSAPPSFKAPEAETGHWYTRTGKSAYQVKAKSGSMRGTTLADARKLDLLPSVTTVLNVVAKDALTKWKVSQAVMSALTMTRNPGESDDDFIARIVHDSREQAKAAAEEGDRIHDACEQAMKGRPYDSSYTLHVEAAQAELDRLFPEIGDWIAEASFAHELGYGGKVDLHSPSSGIVVDYKSKDGDFSNNKKLDYDQNIQLAAYQRGLILPANVCANIFVSRTHPGKVSSHLWKLPSIAHGWEQFEAALRLWKAIKKYDPAFTNQERAA